MRGRLMVGLGAVGIAALFVLPLPGGVAQPQRGGNHGCSSFEGSAYSDHFFSTGDEISWGIAFQPGSPLPPGTTDQDVLRAVNDPAGGEGPSSIACGAEAGTWTSVSSSLGAGDDSVRFDAKDLEADPGQSPFEPLGKLISTTVNGGSGEDIIRGHKGFDNIRAGSGADVVKADDGRPDNVNCGRGQDKADVDNKDDLKSCEKTT